MDAILWFNEFSKGNNEFPVSSKVKLGYSSSYCDLYSLILKSDSNTLFFTVGRRNKETDPRR